MLDLMQTVETNPPISIMTFHPNGAPLRTLRKRSGLSQRELAQLLGFDTGVPVFRHECSRTYPDLWKAVAYEIIFGVPISSQFPSLYRSVEPVIEKRILELKAHLEALPAKGTTAARNARKLEFFWERENGEFE